MYVDFVVNGKQYRVDLVADDIANSFLANNGFSEDSAEIWYVSNEEGLDFKLLKTFSNYQQELKSYHNRQFHRTTHWGGSSGKVRVFTMIDNFSLLSFVDKIAVETAVEILREIPKKSDRKEEMSEAIKDYHRHHN